MLSQASRRRFSKTVSLKSIHLSNFYLSRPDHNIFVQYKNFVNGQWVESKGPLTFDVINPVSKGNHNVYDHRPPRK